MPKKANKKYKLAILTSHPVQYHVPLFKKIASHPDIDLEVYFTTKLGTEGKILDPGFGKKIKWDIPLLEGYSYTFLKNYSSIPKSSFWGRINPGIIKELKNKNYDAVIVFGYTKLTHWLVFLTKWFHKTPIIIKGEADLNKKVGFIKKIIKKIILRILFKLFDAFLYSYNLNKEFFKYYGATEENTFFFPCAVDNDYFEKKKKGINSEIIKRNLNIKPSAPVILFVGKFIERKRPFDLLKAYKKLTKTLDMKLPYLVFVGDGPLRKKMEKYIADNKLERVVITGFKNQSEIPKMYSIADIFVLPSEFDPSPKVINEAMNFSLPIIVTTGVGTAEDLVLKNECGLRYPIGDVETLTQYFKKLIKDEGFCTKLGRNSYQTVTKLWNAKEDVKGLISALEYIKKSRT